MPRLVDNPDRLWFGERPKLAPGGTLFGPTGKCVSHPVFVLTSDNFERAEQAIALGMAHGLLGPGR
jgi:hypothetical protein